MKERSVKEQYGLWAKEYDVEFNPAIISEKEKPIKSLGKLKGKKVLDLGCGTGRNSVKIAEKGAEVIGIDLSKEMLEIAREKAEKFNLNIQFIEQDFSDKIKFKSEKFDVIICDLVFGHLKDTFPVIKEMKRVLKKRGIIVITDLHPFAWFLPPGRKYDVFSAKKVKSQGYKHYIYEMFRQFKKAGLNLLDIEEFIIDKKIENLCKKQGFSDKKGQVITLMYVLKK